LPEKKEIQQLIERAERMIKAAEYLFKEGFYEDAVSRAYYSMCFADVEKSEILQSVLFF